MCGTSIHDAPTERTNAGSYVYYYIARFHLKKLLITVIYKDFCVTGVVEPFVIGNHAPV
jgi:hypothetical protein